jgi:hypothetical protein
MNASFVKTFSISAFVKVESAANRLFVGMRHSRITPVSSELNPLLQRQRRMKCDCIRARIRDCVCQKNDLNLLLCETAAVDLLKHAYEGVDEFR